MAEPRSQERDFERCKPPPPGRSGAVVVGRATRRRGLGGGAAGLGAGLWTAVDYNSGLSGDRGRAWAFSFASEYRG